MNKFVFFDFEEDLQNLHTEMDTLEQDASVPEAEKRERLAQLERNYNKRLSEIYANLTDWQVTQIARHPARPYTLDYIRAIFTDFTELHGDRMFADDASIVAGLAHLGKHPVAVIGHQKGRDTKERARRNFGMAKPEGFRKAERIMRLAEKFSLPLITFVDTPGAYPGIDAEERNQSEAIGKSILTLSQLKTPTISVVIGEGGSGGALALAVTDVVMILQYAIYSVISPEGCASILWKDASKAPTAAETLSLTAPKLLRLGLVDKIISEPLGGAHRDPALVALTLKKALLDQLLDLKSLSTEELLSHRNLRLKNFGMFEEDKVKEVEKTSSVNASSATTEVKKETEAKEEKREAIKDEPPLSEVKEEEPLKEEPSLEDKPQKEEEILKRIQPEVKQTPEEKVQTAEESPATSEKEKKTPAVKKVTKKAKKASKAKERKETKEEKTPTSSKKRATKSLKTNNVTKKSTPKEKAKETKTVKAKKAVASKKRTKTK